MAIGNWGTDVVFSVSDQRVLTFSGRPPRGGRGWNCDTHHTVGSSWAMHSRMGLKDQTEYLRPNLQKLTFTITLDCNYGVRPRAILDMLARHAERGDVYAFVVGGKRVGRYRWRITDLSEAWEVVYNRGELARAKVNVTMEEYI